MKYYFWLGRETEAIQIKEEIERVRRERKRREDDAWRYHLYVDSWYDKWRGAGN